MKYDVVIIGAGLGGLTAGLKLTREGKKVAIVEQHFIPGGCATTFKRKGYTVEVGLHELDGLYEGDNKVDIFKEFGVFDGVNIIDVPEFYRYRRGEFDFVLPDSADEAKEALKKRFPEEDTAIDTFFDIIISLRNELSSMPQITLNIIFKIPFIPIKYPYFLKYNKYTVSDFLDSITDNEELKMLFAANTNYYHDDPQSLSLLYFAAGQGSYFQGGGHYIQGGSQKLSNYLADEITKRGGEIFYRTLATKITENKGVVTGIHAQNTKTDEDLVFEAPVVIANNAIPNLIDMHSSKETALKEKQRSHKYDAACSITTLYLGFTKQPSEFGCKHYSTFIAAENVTSLKGVSESLHGPFSERGYVFVDYSQIDSQLAPEGKGLGAICVIDYMSEWEHLTKEEYKAKKQEVADILIERLNKEYPGIKEVIEYSEVGSPKTIERYTLNPEGSPYGFAQTPHQAIANRIKQRGVLKGFYYASAWTIPGGGFTGAINSGYSCARQVLYSDTLRIRFLSKLLGLFKRRK